MSTSDPFKDHPFPTYQLDRKDLLTLAQKREVDYYAVSQYDLPIELMMENAGLSIARLVAKAAQPGSNIVIGCGKGNNGGGGLVAARRLRAWGYRVYLDLPEKEAHFRSLPAVQLKRALAFGVKKNRHKSPDLAVDAYFGFNYHRPMEEAYFQSVTWMNQLDCPKVSLDLPSGLTDEPEKDELIMEPDAVCVLAAPQVAAFHQKVTGRIFIADLGIPRKAFSDLNIPIGFDFSRGTLFEAQLKDD